MCSHGKVQAGDNVSETMPSAGIEPATSRTAVEGANHYFGYKMHAYVTLFVKLYNILLLHVASPSGTTPSGELL